jgi:3-hydroxybutyryl-CoA dehydrogenase
MTIQFSRIGIVGAGAMGRGIAQMAAQAGSQVLLFDNQPGASEKARTDLFAQWDKLLEKGRLDEDQNRQYKSRVTCANALADLSGCALVVEAIVEKLEVKTALFAALEEIVSDDTVLASNTSSLSITAIAARLRLPQRFAGAFLQPGAPDEGGRGDRRAENRPRRLRRSLRLCAQMGHKPVQAQTPRASSSTMPAAAMAPRPCASSDEGVADFATIDRILRTRSVSSSARSN